MDMIKNLYRSENGATAVEYGLIAALIAIAAITAINGVANSTIDMWDDVAEKVSTNS
ncbi:MAG: Flp family type IVb pilin [Sphingorhabdus sp.]|nr:Flp family type IVb pilin [Sphingorhabdus sp.]